MSNNSAAAFSICARSGNGVKTRSGTNQAGGREVEIRPKQSKMDIADGGGARAARAKALLYDGGFSFSAFKYRWLQATAFGSWPAFSAHLQAQKIRTNASGVL